MGAHEQFTQVALFSLIPFDAFRRALIHRFLSNISLLQVVIGNAFAKWRKMKGKQITLSEKHGSHITAATLRNTNL